MNKPSFLTAGIGLIVVLMVNSVAAQIQINEVSARNYEVYEDEFGKYEDWIEMHNTTDSIVNLDGWTISDQQDEKKFTFPDYKMNADEHLVILASDRNLRHVVDHWETAVNAYNDWKYLPTVDSVPPGWMNPDYVDSTWQTGSGGFGRGDGDDNTVLPDSITKVFIRKNFTVSDTSAIDGAFLHVDYDDAFVAYLNGQELARNNVGCPGVPIVGYDIAGTVHEAQMFQGGDPEGFRIKQEELLQKLNPGTNTLAITGVNAWNNHGNFSLIPFLSLAIRDTSQFFQPTPDWFSVAPYHFHTNFKLSGEGEAVFLWNEEGHLTDSLDYTDIVQTGHSLGRSNNIPNSIHYFDSPTPGAPNPAGKKNYTTKPYITVESGFYEEPVEVRVMSNMFESTVRYTLDGSPPTNESPVYEGPLTFDSTVVLRARAYVEGYLAGEIATRTYLIGEDVDLPVFSVSMDPHLLWDEEEGMYVKGDDAEPTFPYYGANFWNDWERPAHVEYFNDEHDKVMGQKVGIKIHGSVSRAYDMKSLRLNARGIYGHSRMKYKFFPGKEDQTYKKLILRNSGQDFNKSHFRDGLMNKMVQNKTHIDNMAYKPTVVFLNGQYWGIHNMREKIGKWYVGDNHPEADIENLDMLFDNFNVIEGDIIHYWHMIDFLDHTMIFDEQAYDSLQQLLDIKNYTDYFASEIYYSNLDWPNNNIKYWRPKREAGRWRYIMFDLDPGMGMNTSPSFNMLDRVLHDNFPYTDNPDILRKMLQYEDYEHDFINRFADLLNTIFKPENVQQSIDSVVASIEDEMPRHMEKWDGSLSVWENNINSITNFADNRAEFQRQHLMQEFDLNGEITLTAEVKPQGSGKVRISTITASEYPWSGIYFDGCPVPIKAEGKEGYMFSHWERNDFITDTLTNAHEIAFDTSATVVAHFVEDTTSGPERKITISEINYRSADSLDAGDWVELHNYGSDTVNLSNWLLKNGEESHVYAIPFGTKLAPEGYLVISNNLDKFHSIYPDVNNVIGSFDFGYDSDGEAIRLFDASEEKYLDMTYDDEAPWPENVSGTGRTLELSSPGADLNDGSNWFAGCIGGSPGGPYEECEKEPGAVAALEEEPERSGYKVYPNPATERLNIFVPMNHSRSQCRLFDLYGRKIKEKQRLNPGNNTVAITGLKPGVYILQVFSDKEKEKVQKKVLVK
ncbi:MAG: CotH kinase family protein [Bacteroidales bacterium]|nr:CotH kinase family protein [Bacteroidales bacterium]MCF8333421.1 CotH kinase family protein [Bacteroidales bacterium]